MRRGALAQVHRMQSTRNWASYGVLDDDDDLNTESRAGDDFDTVTSTREVHRKATSRRTDTEHEVLKVASDSATSFFCFNEETSVISNYVRALYYSAISLKVTHGEISQSAMSIQDFTDFLQIEIISATDLAIADYIGSSDPYCIVVWRGEKVFKTRHINRNLNPEWNETFHIPLSNEELSECDLSLCVYDYDGNNTFVNDDFLGQIDLGPSEMPWCKGAKVDGVSKMLAAYFDHSPYHILTTLLNTVRYYYQHILCAHYN